MWLTQLQSDVAIYDLRMNLTTHLFRIMSINILSTREQPHFLKIGVTTRSVEQRVKEINSATGVVIPFGVRAVWPVRNPEQIEREIHELLSPYRVRVDREFFQINYQGACRKILDFIKAKDSDRRH